MACCPFSAKPSSEPMMHCCQLGPYEKTLLKLTRNTNFARLSDCGHNFINQHIFLAFILFENLYDFPRIFHVSSSSAISLWHSTRPCQSDVNQLSDSPLHIGLIIKHPYIWSIGFSNHRVVSGTANRVYHIQGYHSYSISLTVRQLPVHGTQFGKDTHKETHF